MQSRRAAWRAWPCRAGAQHGARGLQGRCVALESRCAAWRAWLAGQVRGLGEQVRSEYILVQQVGSVRSI